MFVDNFNRVLEQINNGNNLGEKITLVGATKFVDVDVINFAIDNGLKDIGENKAQELRDKLPLLKSVNKHFIGRIQSNKLKYIVGNVSLIQSVDNQKIACEINEKSKNLGLKSNILLEINVGGELSKGGIELENAVEFYEDVSCLESVQICGLMAMLPNSQDQKLLSNLTIKMRDLYEKLKSKDNNIKYLSMGMSNDYLLTVKNGSNMIRLGSTLFGKRNYEVK